MLPWNEKERQERINRAVSDIALFSARIESLRPFLDRAYEELSQLDPEHPLLRRKHPAGKAGLKPTGLIEQLLPEDGPMRREALVRKVLLLGAGKTRDESRRRADIEKSISHKIRHGTLIEKDGMIYLPEQIKKL